MGGVDTWEDRRYGSKFRRRNWPQLGGSVPQIEQVRQVETGPP